MKDVGNPGQSNPKIHENVSCRNVRRMKLCLLLSFPSKKFDIQSLSKKKDL